MLVSHSRNFFRYLLILSMFVICLVLIFNLSQNSVRLGIYIIPENISNPGSAHQQKKDGMVTDTEFAKLFDRLSSGVRNSVHLLPDLIKWKKLCPTISPKLIGWTNVSDKVIFKENDDFVQRKMAESGVQYGGRYKTKECKSRHRVAIIVPLRNRTEHLTIFLRYMHPFLQRQQLDYAIIVIEQTEGAPFNRGMLMNVGFVEAQSLDNFQCFIFHDVDLLPENDGNPYSCPENGMPRQMSFSLDFWDNYKPTPLWHFGGVTALTTIDFREINGFSNAYWGWGGEDSDLFRRVKFNNLTSTRTFDGYPALVHLARYTSLSHKKAEPSPNRFTLLAESANRLKSDGLIDLNYKRLNFQLKPLYTSVLVAIQQPTY